MRRNVIILCIIFASAFHLHAVTASATCINGGTASGKPGDSVEISLSLSECPGFANIGIEVSYDRENLTLTNAAGSNSVGAVFVPSQSTAVYPYVMTWNSISNVIYSGTLATLTFKINDSAPCADYPVYISYQKGINGNYKDGSNVNYDEKFNSLGLEYSNGTISVISNAPKTPAPTGEPDNSMTYKLSYDSDSNTVSATSLFDDLDPHAEKHIVCAYYDGYDHLIGTQGFNANNDNSLIIGDLELSQPSAAKYCKAFVWDSLSGMKPLAQSLIVRFDDYGI